MQRRSLLAAAGACLSTALAGCAADSSESSPTATATPSETQAENQSDTPETLTEYCPPLSEFGVDPPESLTAERVEEFVERLAYAYIRQRKIPDGVEDVTTGVAAPTATALGSGYAVETAESWGWCSIETPASAPGTRTPTPVETCADVFSRPVVYFVGDGEVRRVSRPDEDADPRDGDLVACF